MPNATKMKVSLRNHIYFNFLASGVKPYTIAWIYEIMLDDIITFSHKVYVLFSVLCVYKCNTDTCRCCWDRNCLLLRLCFRLWELTGEFKSGAKEFPHVTGGQHLTAVSSSAFQECGLNFMFCAQHTWDNFLCWYDEKSHDSNGSDALRLMPHTALEKAKDKNNLVLSNERHFHTT